MLLKIYLASVLIYAISYRLARNNVYRLNICWGKIVISDKSIIILGLSFGLNLLVSIWFLMISRLSEGDVKKLVEEQKKKYM